MGSIETELIKELSLKGYNYKGINDIYRHKLPTEVVQSVLHWLPSVYKEHIGSGDYLCRSLISATEPFKPDILIYLFENSNYNSTLKWTMAYVLSISKTEDISGWLLSHLIDKESSLERSGFLHGLPLKAKIKIQPELMEVLQVLFNKYYEYEYYLKLYQKYALKEDTSFLKKQLHRIDLYISLNFIKKKNNQLTPKEMEKSRERYKKTLMKMIEKIDSRKIHAKFPVSLI